MPIKLNMLDTMIQEIKRAIDEKPNQEYFELSRTTLKYLLENIDRYREIEKTMRARFGADLK